MVESTGIDERYLFTKAALARRYSDQTTSTLSSYSDLEDLEDDFDGILSPPRSPVKMLSPPRSPIKMRRMSASSPPESPIKMGAPSTKLLMSVIAQEMAKSLVRATAERSSLDESYHSSSSAGSASVNQQLADLEALLKTMTDKRDNPGDLAAYLMSKLQVQDHSTTEYSENEVEETPLELFHPGFLTNNSAHKKFDEDAELVSPVKMRRDFSYSPPSSPGRRLSEMLESLPEIMSESGHDDDDEYDDDGEAAEFADDDEAAEYAASPVKKRNHFDYTPPTSPGRGLQDILAGLPEIMSDSDDTERDNDEISVISDITGYTGDFTQSEMPKAVPVPEPVVKTTTYPLSPSKKSSKVVSFGTVHVRSYERIMSDNPGAASGPSIGIGWAFAQEETETVDEFDEERQGTRKQKRSKILLSGKKREKLLLKLGYAEKDIAEMVRKTNKCRNQRRNTITNLENARMEEVVESARRMVAQALFLKKERTLEKSMIEC